MSCNKVLLIEKTGSRAALKTCLNLVITGNPGVGSCCHDRLFQLTSILGEVFVIAIRSAGTGKTSFARLLFKFLYAYGLLQKNNFVEKNALELKAKHVGGTAPLVKSAVNEAMGGCLFLDEAYALIDTQSATGGHSDPFSQDAIRTLLTEVENNRENLMVVLAGYDRIMYVNSVWNGM
jgi:hypothetical protein